MSLNAGKVLKINITTDPKDTILEYVQKYLNQSIKNSLQRDKKDFKPLIIVTPNAEQLVQAEENIRFAKMLNWADIAIPDGIGVVFAMRYFGKKTDNSANASSIQRIAGVDFMQDLVSVASRERVTIGLIGGRPGLAVKALECLNRTRSKLNGWAQDAPHFFIENNELKIKNYDQKMQETYFTDLAKKIKSEDTGMLFVGLGAPKQEYFIESLVHALSLRTFVKQSQGDRHALQARDHSFPIILMSVGGSFDLIVGSIKRAPHLVRLIGFEWAWRLFQEPWRWRRQLALFRFIWLLFKQR